MNLAEVRAALALRKTTVRKVALKHGASPKTVYAVLNGARPGNSAEVRSAIAEITRVTRSAMAAMHRDSKEALNA